MYNITVILEESAVVDGYKQTTIFDNITNEISTTTDNYSKAILLIKYYQRRGTVRSAHIYEIGDE